MQDAGNLISRLVQSMTDAEGVFTLGNVKAGTYEITASVAVYGSGSSCWASDSA